MDKGMHSDGSMSPSARTAPWTCQNCTNANDAGFTTCVHCDMYHLDAREAGPLVTRLGAGVSGGRWCGQRRKSTRALRRFCNSGVPGDSDDDEGRVDEPGASGEQRSFSPAGNDGAPSNAGAVNGNMAQSRHAEKSSKVHSGPPRLKGFAKPVTGYVYERFCEKHREFKNPKPKAVRDALDAKAAAKETAEMASEPRMP